MTGSGPRRYPTHLFTRQHLEPIEKHRATILDRDEHTCLAAGVQITGRYWPTPIPCAPDLIVTTAAVDVVDEPANPIHLRTFCLNHAALAHSSGHATRLLYALNGWRAPDRVGADVLRWAAIVPVRGGASWWLLDSWGERRPITEAWAHALRTEIDRRWPR